MPSRARPTVPHTGALPHREHRADGGRRQFHRMRKAKADDLRDRLEEIREDEIRQQIDEIKNAT